MLKAIKIQIYPNNDQIIYINKLLGSARFVYNNCLGYKIDSYADNKKSVSFSEIGKHLTELKHRPEYFWLNESHSKVLQQSIIDLNIAYNNFFRRVKQGTGTPGFPKFKSRHLSKQSCRFPTDAISKVRGNQINLITQLKNINFKCSRKDEIYLNRHQETIKSATLTKTKSNKFFISILVDRQLTKRLPVTNNMIGIDLGIKEFVITSEGETFDNIKIKRNNQKKLSKLHRGLSRKQRGSNNRNKSKIKLSKFYEKLNNQKEYYLHQVSNSLLNENQIIAMENLNISGMLKNHKLARSIQELSLSYFKSILQYKASWYDRQIIEVDRFFPSSKLCSNCGHKNTDLTLNDRQWTCDICGTEHDRDINAAINILNEGKRLINKTIRMSSPKSTLVESSPLGSQRNKKQLVFY